MLRNYILLAFRNIKRQPGYTLLNVLGLTVGSRLRFSSYCIYPNNLGMTSFTSMQIVFIAYRRTLQSPIVVEG